MQWWPSDWSMILVPDAPVAELVVRGTAIYFVLFAVMRVTGRRLLGNFSMTDILVTLLIAVSVRNGITGGYHTVGDAAISAAVILLWDVVLDRAAYRFARVRDLIRHAPLPILKDGELLVQNARANLLTRTEIAEKLRAKGVSSFDQVAAAYLEPDGTFSVVTR